MSRLFEAVCIQDGQPRNLELHDRRMNGSRKEFYGKTDPLKLEEHIIVPDEFKKGKVKCRIEYSETIEKVEYIPYQQRTIRSLRLVEANDLDYSHKYSDKSRILKLLETKGPCDDILIVKNGLVTDTSFSNIILFDGMEWVTPSEPLLKGTKREYLLSKKIIAEKEIKPADLAQYHHISLINAMLNPGEIMFETVYIIA